jgi:hypothetical protein
MFFFDNFKVWDCWVCHIPHNQQSFWQEVSHITYLIACTAETFLLVEIIDSTFRMYFINLYQQCVLPIEIVDLPIGFICFENGITLKSSTDQVNPGMRAMNIRWQVPRRGRKEVCL